jgi:hypothetical protein
MDQRHILLSHERRNRSPKATFELLLLFPYTIWVRSFTDQHILRICEQVNLRPMSDDGGAMDELDATIAGRKPLYRRNSLMLDTEASYAEANASALVHPICSARPTEKVTL